ncbi:CU044_5270 family protein [Kitasatospora sp. NPDC004614]|uniref:CU044_5270 family protein n=1 Tax=unclassified Kitasatospora TaxID=2633591 RepID=UPI0036A93B3F
MDEITGLAEFRADTAPMTTHARLRGRRQLEDAIAGTPAARRGRRLTTRRVLVAVALTTALTAGLVSTQIAGPGATESSAHAVSVLNLAADALAADKTPAPRPDQFVYLDSIHTTSDPNAITTVQRWLSVDGSKPGLVRWSGPGLTDASAVERPSGGLTDGSAVERPSGGLTDGSAVERPSGGDIDADLVKRSSGGLSSQDSVVEPQQASPSLYADPPYDKLAKLPTDPDALLEILYADPFVHWMTDAKNMTREVAVWTILRSLMGGPCPAPQKAALFRAAAKIPNISYHEEATDALGRTGEAVSLLDPKVGIVQLILDRKTHAFLGERILGRPGEGHDGTVAFNSAVRKIALVDAVGQLPS